MIELSDEDCIKNMLVTSFAQSKTGEFGRIIMIVENIYAELMTAMKPLI